MAILSGGPNSGFSGKVGSVVGYYRMGKWVIRGLPKPSAKNKRGTESQKASRSAFTMMQLFLSPILDFVRLGFRREGFSRQMTAHNAAKSYNMLNAFTPDGEIDCSKVLISFGKLPTVSDPTVVLDDVGIHFGWTNNKLEKGMRMDDQVMVLAYDTKLKTTYGKLNGARRQECRETIFFDRQDTEGTFHTWIAVISDDRERISSSTYLGEIVY